MAAILDFEISITWHVLMHYSNCTRGRSPSFQLLISHGAHFLGRLCPTKAYPTLKFHLGALGAEQSKLPFKTGFPMNTGNDLFLQLCLISKLDSILFVLRMLPDLLMVAILEFYNTILKKL